MYYRESEMSLMQYAHMSGGLEYTTINRPKTNKQTNKALSYDPVDKYLPVCRKEFQHCVL